MLQLEESRKNAYKEFLTAHSRMIEVMDAEMARSRMLPLTWYDVLVTLECADDHSLRMSDLAERVLLSRSGLTRLVEKLERVGYVERKNCTSDKRGTHAVLTQLGKNAREQNWPLLSSLIQELFGSHMSDSDVQVVTTVMQRITESVERFKSVK